MADLYFVTYAESDWLWDYLDHSGTPYRYDPLTKTYFVYGDEKKHEFIRRQLRKGSRLDE